MGVEQSQYLSAEEEEPVAEQEDLSLSAKCKRWLKRNLYIIFIFLLLTAIGFAVLFRLIVITVQSGEAAVLFERFSGTRIDKVYTEGLHIFSPLDIVEIYEIRKRIAFHEFDVISNKGLTVHLSLAIRYRPEVELLGLLHQKIGPDYLSRVILPQIESVMRKELGNYTAEQIYTNEAGLLTKAILKALDEVGRNYVEVDDIIIRSITLPPQIVQAIEEKLTQEEFMKSYEFLLQTAEQEAERKRIEARGTSDYHKIIDESLTESVLLHKGIDATKELAESDNAKVIVIGGDKDGLPLILNTGEYQAPTRQDKLQQKEKQQMTAKAPDNPVVMQITESLIQ